MIRGSTIVFMHMSPFSCCNWQFAVLDAPKPPCFTIFRGEPSRFYHFCGCLKAVIFWFEEDQELQEKYRSLNEERMELVQRLEQDRPGGFQGFVFSAKHQEGSMSFWITFLGS